MFLLLTLNKEMLAGSFVSAQAREIFAKFTGKHIQHSSAGNEVAVCSRRFTKKYSVKGVYHQRRLFGRFVDSTSLGVAYERVT